MESSKRINWRELFGGELLAAKKAYEKLGISKTTWYRWREHGQLPRGTPLSDHTVRYDPEEIGAYIDARANRAALPGASPRNVSPRQRSGINVPGTPPPRAAGVPGSGHPGDAPGSPEQSNGGKGKRGRGTARRRSGPSARA
jgi:predicted DNA-binding transcriptional regulator AlpA